jgi:glycosyl transferase family 87
MKLTETVPFKARLSQTWDSKNLSILLFAYFLISLIAAGQNLLHVYPTATNGERIYTDYNNYEIFKFSFFHLIHGKDIYQLFPEDHWDLYKYSPTFSLFFGLLAWLPDSIGVILWHLINAMCLYAGIRMLRGISDKKKSWILLLCLPELLISIQNTQSNGLMAGLIILGFALAERSKFALSAFCLVFSVYIKLFSLVAFVIYLLSPRRLTLIAWSCFWMILLAALPLTVVDAHQLAFLYKSWLNLLQNDHSASFGLSVMGLMHSWLHLDLSKNLVALAGLLLFALPLIHIRQYKDYYFRLSFLASVLIWVVIFNHKAESPTFVIALSGVGIWYFSQTRSTLNLVLVIMAFLLVTMSVSDIVPSHLKQEIFKPYGVKAIMPVIIWCKLLYEQLTLKYSPERLV